MCEIQRFWRNASWTRDSCFSGWSGQGIMSHLFTWKVYRISWLLLLSMINAIKWHGDYWHAESSPDQWTCFDFKEKQNSLTDYTLKTHNGRTGKTLLLQWVIEGSNDGADWKIFDRRNTQDSNGPSRAKTFKLISTGSDAFRNLRFRQDGKVASGHDYLVLSSVVLFGSICNQTERILTLSCLQSQVHFGLYAISSIPFCTR